MRPLTFKLMSAKARLNTKKLLGFLISFTERNDTMLMALRKNPSTPAGGGSKTLMPRITRSSNLKHHTNQIIKYTLSDVLIDLI